LKQKKVNRGGGGPLEPQKKKNVPPKEGGGGGGVGEIKKCAEIINQEALCMRRHIRSTIVNPS